MNATTVIPGDAVVYDNNRILNINGHSFQKLAHLYGTPLYVYSLPYITKQLNTFRTAFQNVNIKPKIHFAIKSNSNQAILTELCKEGCGMDIVSAGELKRALKAGVAPDSIVFSGAAKSDQELREAVQANILQINVESFQELKQLDNIAQEFGRTVPVALRINPDINALTHNKISTGRRGDKFGIDILKAADIYVQMLEMKGVDPQGIAVHIGSQLLAIEPFAKAYKEVADLAVSLMAKGVPLKRLDLGGGLGIAYKPEDVPININTYAQMVKDTVGHTGLDIHFEPGRWIVGNAGVLLGTVENIKESGDRTFVLTDVGMNDLPRPSLYEAYHHILPVKQPGDNAPLMNVDVVGPVCESGDYIALNRQTSCMKKGDIFAVLTAGAYGMSMTSNYNTRPRPAEILITEQGHKVIRARETLEEIISKDIVPD